LYNRKDICVGFSGMTNLFAHLIKPNSNLLKTALCTKCIIHAPQQVSSYSTGKKGILDKIKSTVLDSEYSSLIKYTGTTGAVAFNIFAWYKMREAWRRRQFHKRILVSVNSVDHGTLKFRSLFEKNLEDVLLNNGTAMSIVRQSQKLTPIDEPFLQFAHRGDCWHILNSLLNTIAEINAQALIAKDLGVPVKSDWYWFGITFEKWPDIKLQKLRVMLVKQELLVALPSMPTPRFEISHHKERWKTLQRMAQIYNDQKQGTDWRLMRIELCAPYYPLPNDSSI